MKEKRWNHLTCFACVLCCAVHHLQRNARDVLLWLQLFTSYFIRLNFSLDSVSPPFTSSSYLFSGSTASMFGDVQRDGFSCISYVLQCKLYFFAKGCFLQEQKKKSPVWDTGLRSFQLSFDGSEDVFNCASLIITWLPLVTIHVLGIMCRLNKLTKSVFQILETVSSRMDWITWFTSKAFRKSTTNVTYVDAMLSSGLLTIF